MRNKPVKRAQSSPRLAELFHAYSAPGGRDADSERSLLSYLGDDAAPPTGRMSSLAGRWLRKTWGLVRRCVLQTPNSRRAALEALEKGALCGTGSQQVLNGTTKMRRRGSHYMAQGARKGREGARASRAPSLEVVRRTSDGTRASCCYRLS